MNIRSSGLLALAGALFAMALVGSAEPAAAGQYAVILQAGKESHEGTARAVHALLYSKEFKEHGHAVVLIFDGAGTEWAEELSNPAGQSKLKSLYDELKATGVVQVICDFCAAAFGVKERLAQRQAPLVAEYAGHPSIAVWVERGYQLIVL